MPLYMDIHHIESIRFTEEDAYRAHLRDIAVQNQYGLIYKKYYLNLEQRTICCLMEGPSMKACIESHQDAHGIGPCNVIEISPEDEFHPYMGEGYQNEKDLALTLSGEVDTGYRTLMQINLHSFLRAPSKDYEDIARYISDYGGKIVEHPESRILASFIKPKKAISCAVILRDYLRTFFKPPLFTIAVVTGKPVEKTGTRLFDRTLNRLTILSHMGQNAKITVDEPTRISYERFSKNEHLLQHLHMLSEENENLLCSLCEAIKINLDNAAFKTAHLQETVGASKTKTYRKIKALTNFSPNELIREYRLRHSLSQLRLEQKTVSEIAYAHGFNSATYFTRIFKERFGILPTDFVKHYIT